MRPMPVSTFRCARTVTPVRWASAARLRAYSAENTVCVTPLMASAAALRTPV